MHAENIRAHPPLSIRRLSDREAAARLIPDDILDRFIFAGDPADIIEQCARLCGAGAQRIELGTPHGVSEAATGIRLIGEQVLPALAPYLSTSPA